ncbi:MAG: glycosyltransferase family 4 protein, partial [Anaerolineales bacterium]|nr:glycosyltransferase family 4 protein [Anaerolineales bacterium]
MRISLINPNLVAEDAIGQCLLNQARFLQRRGDEVRVFTVYPPEHMSEAITAATRVITLADLIERRDSHFASSDVYVYHYPVWYPLLESIRGIDRGVVIFYYHNVTPPELWGSEFERESLQRSVDSVGSVIHYADLVVTDSAFNADQLAENYGCERDRIRVLPLAVPTDQFKPGPPDLNLVRQYGLEGRRVILFVGRMAGNKRIDLLVEALALVRQEVPQATLLLVGDERSNPAIVEAVSYARQRAAALGVDDVIFTGRVASVADHFRLAHVYATASVHEGFGVPLIEAMASGVPVVASRATAHPEVLGDAGLLAEPNNAADMARHIVSVLTDDALCGDLVRRGLARAAEFSLERYEAGWADVMAEAASWLPNQPYPRPRSALVRSGEKPAESGSRPAARLTPLELLRSETDQLEMAA